MTSPSPILHCDYFDAGRCRSCTLLGVPHLTQVGSKVERARALLSEYCAPDAWLPAVAGADRGFRNKAKMVAGGSIDQPTLGILDRAGEGVDLRDCAITDPRLRRVMGPISALITAARLEPYSVPRRRGDLKNVLVTVSPDGELLVRFVVRSHASVEPVRRELPALLAAAPQVAVVSVNILPEHKAVLEGDEEIVLTERTSVPMRLAGGVTTELGVRSFFQTNSEIAAAMYAQAAAWARGLSVQTAWDLYCGTGGFAIAVAGAGVPSVTGVEVAVDAVEAATRSADNAGLSGTRFIADDAVEWAAAQPTYPDLAVVNPPRRGLGLQLARALEGSGIATVIYSSCNAVTLAADLAVMTSYRATRVRVFDMFPQTDHFETMVLLQRP